jgi:SAM-dependent methyltransferase
MDESLLVKMLGFRATLLHGDSAVLDRWLWLKKRLPETANGERVIDIGCGTGAFSIGAALRGYDVLGLSWSARNQAAAAERARLCHAKAATFEVLDIRELDARTDLNGSYDVAICCETIEHVLDDTKLMIDIARALRPGGRLLLTTPYYHYRPITAGDKGPFAVTEDGGHVRRGYTTGMLTELCDSGDLVVEEISYCTGLLSQKCIWLQRTLSRFHPLLGWIAVLPLRVLPPVFDRLVTTLCRWPYYSICIEAYKPRSAAREHRTTSLAAMRLVSANK